MAVIESLDLLPARMINEAVYCPRLFYLMHVEGLFERNRFTSEGDFIHRRVDSTTDSLESPSETSNDLALDEPLFEHEDEPVIAPSEPSEPIHARSVTLACDELGVIAKLDLVQADGIVATPVDYKRGSPRRNIDGSLGAWPPERVQICLQAMVLRANGFDCDHGFLYFNETRQRVRIDVDEALIEQTRRAVDLANQLRESPMPPPPLVDSPKCPNCSLSPVCLPDETNRCRAGQSARPTRLPTTPRDEQRPLYLNTQGLFVGKSGEVLQVKEQGKLVQEVRIREINQVSLFGNIQLSTQAIQTLCELEVPLVLFSSHGFFHGMLQGTGLKNILLRREQYRVADDPARSLKIAKLLINGKIRNGRVMLMRNHVSPPIETIGQLKRIAEQVHRAGRADELLGIEGNAARLYFESLSGMIKAGDAPMNPEQALGEPPQWTFDFRGRNRRPPRDPVNALLSLAYSLLAKDLTIVAAAVGMDPYLGFYHLPRPGRPALALDLMEPFRPLIAESAVINAINNRMVTPEHFVAAGQAVTLTSSGRKAFFRAYETRMDQLVTHPLFDYRVSYRRLLEIQTRLLAQMVRGEIDEFPVFVSR